MPEITVVLRKSHDEAKRIKFNSLDEFADYIFEGMEDDYTGKYASDRIRVITDERFPTLSYYTKSNSTSPPVTVHKIMNHNGDILYSDGTFTCKQRYIAKVIKNFFESLKNRCEKPTFNFTEEL